MTTAAHVPETYELEGDDALEMLRATGWGRLAADSLRRLRAADGLSHARAIAFQFTLTLLPGLIALVGLATLLGQGTTQRVLRETLLGLAPGPTAQILSEAFRQGAGRGGGSGTSALAFGTLVAVASGTFSMALVERAANRIYGIDRDRPTLERYGRALVLFCSAGVLSLAAFVLLVVGRAIGDAARAAGGWGDALVDAWTLARWPLGVLFVVIAFALLFRRSPRRRQPAMSWLSLGALAAVVLWVLFTALLALYLRFGGTFGQTYGPLAGMIGVLLWAYLSSLALLLGLALAAQLEAVRAGTPAPTEQHPRVLRRSA